MTWRVVSHAGREWKVSLAAERHAASGCWQLILSFRPSEGGRTIWAKAPIESQSQAALYAHAARMPERELTELLASRLQ